jgi:hypothetical protein
MTVNINELYFSQIYLSLEKIEGVKKWFRKSLENFEPICVRDFLNNGNLVVTDGHTRTFVAWKNGIRDMPVIYDDSEIVVCQLGHEQYLNDIIWCKRLNIKHISDFENRILSKEKYTELWINRCEKLFFLVAALHDGSISKIEYDKKKGILENKNFYIYGISKDLEIVYYEDQFGKLYEVKYVNI